MYLNDAFHVEGTEFVADKELAGCLESFEGKDLIHIPECSLTIVPESKDRELRRGIVDSIMSQFRPDRESFTAEDIVIEATDFIYENIAAKERRVLIDRTRDQLKNLANDQLKQYLSYDGKVFNITSSGQAASNSQKSRESIEKKIGSWAGATTLEEFNG